jgi:Holliday junction resolvase RusA-like endonuclease
MTLKISVLGVPVTQGSKSAFIAGGKPYVREKSSGAAHMRFVDWRQAVRSEAQREIERDGVKVWDTSLWAGPVSVECRFSLPKPTSAPKKRRTWPLGARSGDVDKLARLVLDALTGIVFADDSHVVDLHVSKDYGVPGAEILVSAIVIGEPSG